MPTWLGLRGSPLTAGACPSAGGFQGVEVNSSHVPGRGWTGEFRVVS